MMESRYRSNPTPEPGPGGAFPPKAPPVGPLPPNWHLQTGNSPRRRGRRRSTGRSRAGAATSARRRWDGIALRGMNREVGRLRRGGEGEGNG